MDGLEEQIGRLLNDPEQLQRLAGLAQSLMGGESPPQSAPGLPPGILQSLGARMGADAPAGREQALLQAMRPYLSEKRRGKLDRAMELVKMLRLARLAMEAGGGGHDQPL